MSAPAAEVLTPTVPSTARRALFWVGALLVAALLAVASLALAGSGAPGAYLSPENAAPNGARAVAEVLRDRGVDVRFTERLDDTVAAADGDSVTVLLSDDGFLDEEKRGRLAELPVDLVLVNPSADELAQLAPGVELGEAPDGVLAAGCRLPAVDRAEQISRATDGYTVTPDADGATGCLEGAPDTYSLVQLVTDDRTVTVLGAGDALTNEFVIERGNAALALGLLGRTEALVWYLPGLDDVAAPPPLGELSPPWVTPVMLLLILTALAAAIWRGRRFGPLVVENLPVVVRASETMEGRARLYARSSARRRALDALRVGTVTRLATALRLGRTAPVDAVALSVADRTGRDPQQVRNLLLDADPATDAELVRLSDDLLALEHELRAALSAELD